MQLTDMKAAAFVCRKDPPAAVAERIVIQGGYAAPSRFLTSFVSLSVANFLTA